MPPLGGPPFTLTSLPPPSQPAFEPLFPPAPPLPCMELREVGENMHPLWAVESN